MVGESPAWLREERKRYGRSSRSALRQCQSGSHPTMPHHRDSGSFLQSLGLCSSTMARNYLPVHSRSMSFEVIPPRRHIQAAADRTNQTVPRLSEFAKVHGDAVSVAVLAMAESGGGAGWDVAFKGARVGWDVTAAWMSVVGWSGTFGSTLRLCDYGSV